ncbi:MAG TPA: YceI family protein [Candidatus Angelobacter sp.]|nr:YceI family protein [Candidatus Angelobacter sp.]
MRCLNICRKFFLAGLLLVIPTAIAAQNANAPRSSITIHAYKSGLFSGFGHNHTITAPIARGTIDTKKMSVEISVSTKQMKVVDPEVSESTRAEIQADMLGPKSLDVDKYPEIHFQSSRVEQTSPQYYRVTGTLSLHGTSKELSFEVTGGPDRYQGKVKLKQTDFGIQPISAAGGTVKVKDELLLDLDIYAAEMTNGNRR